MKSRGTFAQHERDSSCGFSLTVVLTTSSEILLCLCKGICDGVALYHLFVCFFIPKHVSQYLQKELSDALPFSHFKECRLLCFSRVMKHIKVARWEICKT